MERSFIAKSGTRRQPTKKEIDKDYIGTAKYIHLGPMGEASVQAAIWAREKGISRGR